MGGRLLEVRQIDDAIASTCTGARFQMLWLGQQWIGRWRILIDSSCNPTTATRHFIESDHLGTPDVTMTWPASGDSGVSVNWEPIGPIGFPGPYYDLETEAWAWDASAQTYVQLRPGLHENWARFYDSYTGGYLTGDHSGVE